MSQSFQAIQEAFAQKIRNPFDAPMPDNVDPERMGVYEDLIFNGTNDILMRAFPVMHSILTEQHWEELIRDFLSHHHSESPIFYEVPAEFVEFLTDEREASDDMPFLGELAHYEWVELAVELAPEEASGEIAPEGDVLRDPVVLADACVVLGYEYPVHEIGPAFIPGPQDKAATYLIVFRDENHIVKYMEVNVAMARLVQLLQTGQYTGETALEFMATERQVDDLESFMEAGAEEIAQLKDEGVILGAVL